MIRQFSIQKNSNKIKNFKDRYLRFINRDKTYALSYYIQTENTHYLADSDLMLIALEFNLKLTIGLIDHKLLNDINFLYVAYCRNGIAFVENLPLQIRSNIKLIIQLYKKTRNHLILKSIPDKFKSDIDFLLKLIRIEPKIFEYVMSDLTTNIILISTHAYYTNKNYLKILNKHYNLPSNTKYNQTITKMIIDDQSIIRYLTKTIIFDKYIQNIKNDLFIYNSRCYFTLYNKKLDNNCLNIIFEYVSTYRLKNEISFASFIIIINELKPLLTLDLF